MKKTLLILVVATILTDCNDVGKDFNLKISKDEITWMNGTIRFQTEGKKDSPQKHNPAFQAYVKFQDGHTILMPADTYSLGYGASCPMGTSGLYKPEQGFSEAEILIQTDDKMVIHLHHDPWMIHNQPITLDKQITLFRDSPIMAVIDYYEGIFELLNIAVGLTTANVGTVKELDNGFAVAFPFGITAIIVMPDVQGKTINNSLGSTFINKAIASGEPLRYYVGLSDKGEDFLLEELSKIL